MDPERWQKIEVLYEATLKAKPSQRAALLTERCAGDETLRREVESLLLHEEKAGDFLKVPVREKPLEAGQRVSHYEIQEKLGEGGMGVVYKARDTRLGRSVALKFVKAQFSERFEREARAIAALNHPHIATLYDVGQQEGAPYLAMEFVEGKPMNGPRSAKDVIGYGIQIADAMAAAHAAGIIHRDLKPANILVTDKRSVKVLDFGLAKLRAQAGEGQPVTGTVTAALAGTPGYMSPEQIDGKPADVRSDIFAFGCVLYELASGRHAFEGDSVSKVLAATATTEPKPLTGVPEKLDELIRRCLRKDPERRFQHAGDIKVELEDVRDVPELAQPIKSRAWLMPMVVVAAIAVLALAARLWLTRDDRSVDLANYRLTPFATALPVQGGPSWSPDDRSIAYYGGEDGLTFLCRQSLEAPSPLKISILPSFPYDQPAWTPDSRELYFKSTGGLWKVSAFGGTPALVQHGGISGTISQDGRTLVFLRQTQGPRSFGVWVASPPDGNPRPYEPAPFETNGYHNAPCISFAPDGRKILVVANPTGEDNSVWLLPWPPGQFRRIVPDPPLFLPTPGCSWMPDSRHVLVVARTEPGQTMSLFMGDTETGRFWPVMLEGRAMVATSVSRNGMKVVYECSLGHYDVVSAPLDGARVQTVMGSLRNESMPAYSPAVPNLVYVTNRRGGFEVWIESLTDRWARPILTASAFHVTSGPVHQFMTPALSPQDAQRVAVVAINSAGGRLWITDTSGSAPVRLTSDEVSECAPTWSPTGEWIAYRRDIGGRPMLAKVRVGASEPPVDLIEIDGNILPEWSPTGEWIACAIANRPGITLVSPNGKKTRFLPGESAPLAWSRDGKIIYQVRGTSRCMVVALDVTTGRERVIRGPNDPCPASPLSPGLRVTLAPDGKSLAWAVSHPRSELWILDGLRTPRPWFLRLLGMP